jgi:hypothetical protein
MANDIMLNHRDDKLIKAKQQLSFKLATKC